jgi:AraC-like DNA-binding protein
MGTVSESLEGGVESGVRDYKAAEVPRVPVVVAGAPIPHFSLRTFSMSAQETLHMPAPSGDMLVSLIMSSVCLRVWRMGGGGEVTRFICGYMACDPRLSQVFLSGLPTVFKVAIRNDASGRWLENSIRFSVTEADTSRAGQGAMLAKLSEVLFVETLRSYIASLPPEQTGWLAGARDSEVGKTLALMHRSPAHPWTIASLEKEAGLSRSVLAERFRHYLKEAPMAYLTRWRLQLGAQMLGSTNYSVSQIASEVGYESEAAFNRAFKREFEVPPARFRNQLRAGARAVVHKKTA